MKYNRPLTLGLISGLSALILYGWVGTTAGLVWTLHIVNHRWLSGQLELKEISGCLIGPLQIKSVNYRDSNYQVILTNLAINFKKSSFLKGVVHIKHLHMDQCRVVSHATTNTNLSLEQFWNIKKRYFLEYMRVNNAQFKTDTATLHLQGTLGLHNQLHWKLGYVDPASLDKKHFAMQLQGTLKGNWGKQPHLLGTLHSLRPYVLSTNNQGHQDFQNQLPLIIPKFQGEMQYDSNRFEMRVLPNTDTQNNFSNEINAFAILPYENLNKNRILNQLIQGGLKIRLRDISLLKTMQVPVENLYLNEAGGDVDISSQFQMRVETLMQGWQQWLTAPTSSLYGRLHWEKPSFPDLGSQFNSLTLEGRCDQGVMTWNGLLTASLKECVDSNIRKWNLRGKTHINNIREKLAYHTHLLLTGDALPLFTHTRYRMQLKPDVHITHSGASILLEGTLTIPKAQLDYVYEDPIFFLDKDVRFTKDNLNPSPNNKLSVKTNLKLVLGNKVSFRYTGLTGRFTGTLQLMQENPNQALRAHGELKLLDGNYYYYGQFFKISPHSRLIFNEWVYNPTLDVKAVKSIQVRSTNQAPAQIISTRAIKLSDSLTLPNTTLSTALPMQVEVGVHLGGNIEKSKMILFSNPAYHITDPQDTLAYILTGQSAKNVHAASLFLNTAMQLGQGYLDYYRVLERFRKQLGTTIEIIAGDSINSAQFVFNQKLTNRWSASYHLNLINAAHTWRTHYHYNPNWLVGASFDPMQKLNIEFMHQKEYG